MKLFSLMLSAIMTLQLAVAPPSYSQDLEEHQQTQTEQQTQKFDREELENAPVIHRVRESRAVVDSTACPTACPTVCPTTVITKPAVVAAPICRPAVVRRQHRNWLLPLLVAGAIIATAIAVPIAVTRGNRGNNNRNRELAFQQALLFTRATP